MATSNSANLVTEIAAAPVSFRRRAMNALVTGAAAGAVLLVLLPLGAIFVYLVYKGFGSLNWAFLTQIPKPVGEAGGCIWAWRRPRAHRPRHHVAHGHVERDHRNHAVLRPRGW